jgi:hypothetical protein
MKLWPALLVTPLLALAHVGLGYALVPAACHAENAWLVHGWTAVCLAMALGLTALAWRAPRAGDGTHRFLAMVSILSGSFFSLVIAAGGLAQFVLAPCTHL